MDQGFRRTSRISITNVKRIVVIAALLSAGIYLASCSGEPERHEESSNAAVTQASPTIDPSIDYSKFTHSNEMHARLPCLLCHKYDGATATKISFPGSQNHAPCAGCHVQQFNAPAGEQKSPMCSICHTDPETGAMKAFPRLASFNAKFDHGKHVPQANCATCHKPLQAGQGYSVPNRLNAHASCFQCHAPETSVAKKMAENGTNIDSCSVCHEQGSPRPAHAVARYVGNFSHARHRGMSCNSCHVVRSGSGRDQVSAPVMAFHKASGGTLSCATCHNDKRAFGTADFANCDRCHKGNTFAF